MAAGRGGSSESPISITVEPQAANPRVRIVLRGQVDGHAVADAFIRLYDEQPEAVLYDRLFDLTAYRSGFGLDHLQRIAPAYHRANPDPTYPCRTAFVTHDPNFGLWAASMGFQFNGRDLRAFGDFEEGERFLSEPVAERGRVASA